MWLDIKLSDRKVYPVFDISALFIYIMKRSVICDCQYSDMIYWQPQGISSVRYFGTVYIVVKSHEISDCQYSDMIYWQPQGISSAIHCLYTPFD